MFSLSSRLSCHTLFISYWYFIPCPHMHIYTYGCVPISYLTLSYFLLLLFLSLIFLFTLDSLVFIHIRSWSSYTICRSSYSYLYVTSCLPSVHLSSDPTILLCVCVFEPVMIGDLLRKCAFLLYLISCLLSFRCLPECAITYVRYRLNDHILFISIILISIYRSPPLWLFFPFLYQ